MPYWSRLTRKKYKKAEIIYLQYRFIIISRRAWNAIQRKCTPGNTRNNDKKKGLKSRYVCLAIVVSFVLLWAPYLVHNILLLKNGRMKLSTILQGQFEHVAVVIALVNPMVDPLFFIIFRKDVKRELKRLIWLFLYAKNVGRIFYLNHVYQKKPNQPNYGHWELLYVKC